MVSLAAIKKSGGIGLFTLSIVFSATPVFAQSGLSVDTAIATATQWVNLADANQVERMWNTSGPIMQKNINKADWGKYLGTLQSELGRVNERAWAQVIRITNPANLPAGEYVNVAFSSRFTKSPMMEKISLVQTAGQWVPVGYVVSKIESPVAPAVIPAK